MEYDLFVGTNSVRGSRGIYSLRLGRGERLELRHTHEAYNAGYLALRGARLFAVSEGMTFDGAASGGVLAYAVAPDGALRETGRAIAGGQRPCCLCADASDVYVSNFYGGLCRAFPYDAAGRLAPARLTIDEPALPGLPRALHCVGLLPGGRLGVVSLGRMALLVYDRASGARVCAYEPGEGLHPRHFAVSPDGQTVYLLMQEPAEVHALAFDGASLRRIAVRRLTDERLVFGASAVRVSPDGRTVVCAVRDGARLYVLRAEDLSVQQTLTLPGAVPRDVAFTPDGRYLAAAMQGSDSVAVLRASGGSMTLCAQLGGVPSPACIALREAVK